MEEAISHLPGIRYLSTVAGYSQLSALAQSNSAFFIVTLEPFEDRRSAAQDQGSRPPPSVALAMP